MIWFIFILSFVFYARALFFDFVWDDFYLIVTQDHFRQWANLGQFFTVPFWKLATGMILPYHRPMLPLFILLVSTFSGTNPWGYHLLGVLFFAASSVLFYLFLLRLEISRRAAVLAALIFVFHPVHAEPVSWICCFSLILSGTLFLICLLLSQKLASVTTSNVGARHASPLLLLLLCITYIAGLMAYHFILSLLPVIIVLDWLQKKKTLRTRITEYGFLTFTTLIYFIYTFTVIRIHTGTFLLAPPSFAGVANLYLTGDPWEKWLTPLNIFSRYVELLLAPFHLNPETYLPAAQLSVSALASVVMLISLTGILMAIEKSKARFFLFSMLWMILGMATHLGGLGGFFSDRYLFVASMGFSLWLGLALESFKNHLASRGRGGKIFFVIFTGFLFSFYAYKTWHHSGFWRNDRTFWQEASRLSPHKVRPHLNLAILLEQAGENAEAAEEYRKVILLEPLTYALTHENLVRVLKKLGYEGNAQFYEERFNNILKKIEAFQKNYKKGGKPLLLASNQYLGTAHRE